MSIKVGMPSFLQPLLMALTLLSRLPVSRWCDEAWSAKHYQRSVYYYPLVGLLLAAVLIALTYCLPFAREPYLGSIILLVVWVGLTGALHLDGLADCADAYFAAHKNPEKAMLVFKDPVSGPMGVTAIVLLLLLKAAALVSLGSDLAVAFVVALSCARANAMLMMNSTAYARESEEGGMVSGLSSPALTWPSYGVTCLCLVILFSLTNLATGLVVALSLLVLLLVWRRFWLKFLGGFTGDCLGALIELSEVLVLLIFVLIAR